MPRRHRAADVRDAGAGVRADAGARGNPPSAGAGGLAPDVPARDRTERWPDPVLRADCRDRWRAIVLVSELKPTSRAAALPPSCHALVPRSRHAALAASREHL